MAGEAIIMFELTMPNNNSWNGKWSGEGKRYLAFRKFGRSKAAHEQVARLLLHKNHYYNFGDGWGANVSMTKVTSKEMTKLKKLSAGFCGYNWMCSSIVKLGKILSNWEEL